MPCAVCQRLHCLLPNQQFAIKIRNLRTKIKKWQMGIKNNNLNWQNTEATNLFVSKITTKLNWCRKMHYWSQIRLLIFQKQITDDTPNAL